MPAGTELVGLAASETPNPRTTMPAAVKGTFWRIVSPTCLRSYKYLRCSIDSDLHHYPDYVFCFPISIAFL